MLCDRKFPSRLKGKFYRVAIRPSMLYVTECWPLKKIFEHKDESYKNTYAEVDVRSHNDG